MSNNSDPVSLKHSHGRQDQQFSLHGVSKTAE